MDHFTDLEFSQLILKKSKTVKRSGKSWKILTLPNLETVWMIFNQILYIRINKKIKRQKDEVQKYTTFFWLNASRSFLLLKLINKWRKQRCNAFACTRSRNVQGLEWSILVMTSIKDNISAHFRK